MRRSSSQERQPLPKGFGTIWTTVAIDLIGFGIVLPILQYGAVQRLGPPSASLASFSLAQLVAPRCGAGCGWIGRKPVLLIAVRPARRLLAGVAAHCLFAGQSSTARQHGVSVAQASVADVAPPRDERLMGLLNRRSVSGSSPVRDRRWGADQPAVPFYLAAAISLNAGGHPVRRPTSSPPAEAPVEAGSSGPARSTGRNRGPRSNRRAGRRGRRPSATSSCSSSRCRSWGWSRSVGSGHVLAADRRSLRPCLSGTGAVFTVIGSAWSRAVGLVGRVNDRLGGQHVAAGLVKARRLGPARRRRGAGRPWSRAFLLVLGQGLITPRSRPRSPVEPVGPGALARVAAVRRRPGQCSGRSRRCLFQQVGVGAPRHRRCWPSGGLVPSPSAAAERDATPA